MSYKALQEIQSNLKAPKGNFNSFGKYKYRSCEDILEAVKPLLKEHEAIITLSDSMEVIGTRVYVKATATFKLGNYTESVSAFAREAEVKKGMDDAQITGSASSYARKYALNGLLLIDDTKDADTMDNSVQSHDKPHMEDYRTAPDMDKDPYQSNDKKYYLNHPLLNEAEKKRLLEVEFTDEVRYKLDAIIDGRSKT